MTRINLIIKIEKAIANSNVKQAISLIDKGMDNGLVQLALQETNKFNALKDEFILDRKPDIRYQDRFFLFVTDIVKQLKAEMSPKELAVLEEQQSKDTAQSFKSWYIAAAMILVAGALILTIYHNKTTNYSESEQYTLATSLYNKKDYGAALIIYKEIIEQNPKAAKAYRNIGVIKRKQQKIKEACLYFQKACDLGYASACIDFKRCLN